jgi:hypothetical protein
MDGGSVNNEGNNYLPTAMNDGRVINAAIENSRANNYYKSTLVIRLNW